MSDDNRANDEFCHKCRKYSIVTENAVVFDRYMVGCGTCRHSYHGMCMFCYYMISFLCDVYAWDI